MLLTGCTTLHQPKQADLAGAPLTVDQRFDDLYRLVKGEPNDRQGHQVDFNKALAGYQTDNRFICYHPIYAHYFSHRLGQKTNASQCPPSVPFYLYDHRHGGEVRYVRPDRVVAIHLLFFSNGKRLVSRFGHVGLRLVICPKDAPVAPAKRRQACDQNLFEHVTLGYMAQVDGLNASFYKGLTGGYRAHLMAFPFMDTFFTNTILDDRNIYSLPLKLKPEVIQKVVRELSEIQWSYSGRYRFLTNNCATLLQDALNEILRKQLDKKRLPDATYLRPDHLFAAIKASPMGEAAYLDSLAQAETAGFYFPSNRPYYQKALDLLNQNAGSIQYASLQDYLSASAQQRLQPWLGRPRFSQALAHNKRLLEALTLVEEYALLMTDQQLTQATFKLFAKDETKSQLKALLDNMSNPVERRFLKACYVQPLDEMTRESVRSDGIPNSDFIDRYYADNVDCTEPAIKTRVHAKIRAQLSAHNGDVGYIAYLGNQLSITNNNLELLGELK